jgi:hypothetical protein
MGQECALWSITGLFNRFPTAPRSFWLKVVQHKPEIVDLLFQCLLEPRNPWYPETELQALAAEILANLFAFPTDRIPNAPIALDEEELKKKDEEEMNASLELLRILTGRPEWLSSILAAWKKLEQEDWHKVKK